MRFIKILSVIIILFSSCVTSNNQDVELFINKGNSVQYFFPERSWLDKDGKVGFTADWLYRDFSLEKEAGEPRTILNFTVSSDSILFRDIPDKIIINNKVNSIEIPSENIKVIFIDKGRSRYTAWMYSEEIHELMRTNNDSLNITLNMNKEYVFNSSESFIPHIDYFKEVILGIQTKE